MENSHKSFRNLGLTNKLSKNLESLGYKLPTQIQIESIPAILTGRDLIAIAQTGTGKTAAFSLPIINKLKKGKRVKPNHTKSLILVPTRELAIQVHQSIETYSRELNITSIAVFGGVKINPQMIKLRKGIDILVATPGRLLDLCNKNALRLSQVETLTLDEADKMLSLGFSQEINEILALLPKKRQNLLFSATISNGVKQLANKFLYEPIEINIQPESRKAETVDHCLYPVDKSRKSQLLLTLYRESSANKALIFVKTQHTAKRLTHFLEKNSIKVGEIHGGKSQGSRTTAIKNFKSGSIDLLIATDIIARGLDIKNLPLVINFDLPHVPENYVHRIGRTGRKGDKGHAISLVSPGEFEELVKIERQIQEFIPRKNIDEFDPKEPLRESPKIKPLKPKKPKKKKKKLPS